MYDCLKDRYRIQRILGRGGTSTVYLALDEKIQKQRAVKIVEKSKIPEGEIWIQEFEMLKKLEHKYLAEIIDVFETKEEMIFVMEYVDGQTVKELLQKGKRFSHEEMKKYAGQICEVLLYLHKQNPPVIYRDLKPGNIMIDKNDDVVLIDFGTAREYKPKQEGDTWFWGTVGYAAPEQMTGSCQTDERTDIYSVGITFYEMLTGEKYSAGKENREDSGWYFILSRCLQVKPENRYPNVKTLMADIGSVEVIGKRQKKKRKRKQRGLVLCWGMSLLCFSFSICLGQEADRLLQEGYEMYLQSGDRSEEIQEKMVQYEKAISLDPGRREGYQKILDTCRREGFGENGYQRIMEVFQRTDQTGKIYEQCLKEGGKTYGEFVFELGLACYFEWDGYGDKLKALPWLSIARTCEEISWEKRNQAECLWRIANYYDLLNQQIEGQITTVSYETYWEDLKDLYRLHGNEEMRNIICKEVVSQIFQHGEEFYLDGVPEEEILELIEKTVAERPELCTLAEEGIRLVKLIYGGEIWNYGN